MAMRYDSANRIRRAAWPRPAIGFAALALIAAFSLAAADTDTPPAQLVLELSDGSRIVGTPSVDRLKLDTSYASMDIQLSKLRAIEFGAAPGRAAHVSLQNGDQLNGKLGITEISIKTCFAQVVIPLQLVTRIKMTGARHKGLPEGLVLYYSFDSNSGQNVADESGSENDGTIRGGATRVGDGKIGGAMSFGGSGGQVVATKNEDKLQMQDFTIMAWVKRGSVDKPSNEWEDGVIFTGGQACYGVGIHNDGSIYLCNVGFNAVFSPCKITDDSFHHVAVTKSGDNVVFYLDGKAYETEFSSQFRFGHGFGVGARPDMTGPGEGCFLGTIDEVGVFNRPLSADEVKGVYESQK